MSTSPYTKENTMSRTYTFKPVGLDLWDRSAHQPEPGTLVRKCQPAGCPRNGTMGHCYVEDAATGAFYGPRPAQLAGGVMNDTDRERILDRRIQSRLATDSAYRNAENAEEQADREAEIEQQEIDRLDAEAAA